MIGYPSRGPWAEEAGRVGSAMGLLPTVVDPRRKNPRRPPAKNLLLPQAAQTRAGWKCRRKLEQAMIEKWESSLYAMGHRHTVALGTEQIRRKVSRHLQVRRLIQR